MVLTASAGSTQSSAEDIEKTCSIQEDKKMKTKIIALAMVAIMMVSLVSVAFARPVAKCPDCNGEYRSTSYGEWTSKENKHISSDGKNWILDTWEERTVTIRCSNGTHRHTEKRNSRSITINPVIYGWGQILNGN